MSDQREQDPHDDSERDEQSGAHGGEMDAREQLLDMALHEVLGNERPPDLVARVAKALAEPALPRGPGLVSVPAPAAVPAAATLRWRHWLAGALAGAAAAATVVVLLWPRAPEPRIQLVVTSGEASLRQGERWLPVQGAFFLGRRDRIRSSPEHEVHVVVDDLGTLQMARSTELEVMDMNWKDFGSGAMLGSVTVAVVAGAIVWWSGDSAVNAGVGDKRVLERGAGDVAGERAAFQKLENDLLQAKARIQQLEGAAQRTAVERAAASPEPSSTATPAAAEAKPSVATFGYPGAQEALDSVDWNAVGDASLKLAPALGQLTEAIANGADQSELLKLSAEVQKQNAVLVAQAASIHKGLPAETINGSFTHPLVVANQLHAVFDKAGQPMTEGQRQSLQGMVSRYAAEDEQRRAQYGDETVRLQAMIEESDLRNRFYQDAKGLLSKDQLALIENDHSRGRTIDLFSVGIAWHMQAGPVTGETRAEVANGIGKQFCDQLRLPAAEAAQVRTIVSRWVEKFPEEQWGVPADTLAKNRIQSTDRIREAARMQVGMMNDILRSTNLTPEQRKKLLNHRGVMVPYKGS